MLDKFGLPQVNLVFPISPTMSFLAQKFLIRNSLALKLEGLTLQAYLSSIITFSLCCTLEDISSVSFYAAGSTPLIL